MRDMTRLVQLSSMSQFLASLVHNAWLSFRQQRAAGGNAPPATASLPALALLGAAGGPAGSERSAAPWSALEGTLLACNVVLGAQAQGGAGQTHPDAPDDAAVKTMVDVSVACIHGARRLRS